MSKNIITIQKLDPVKLIKEKSPFTTYRNYVIQNIRDHLALAIWVYLGSMPDDWHVHRTQLMSHFDVGRDRLSAALKYLNENGLIEYIQTKNEAGMFGVSHILVKSGEEFEVIHRNGTAPLKNRTTDFPDNGKTAPTNTIDITNTNQNKNKSFCPSKDQNLNTPVDNSGNASKSRHAQADKTDKTPPTVTPLTTQPYNPYRQTQADNATKHAWADKPKATSYANVDTRSAEYLNFKPSDKANPEIASEWLKRAKMALAGVPITA